MLEPLQCRAKDGLCKFDERTFFTSGVPERIYFCREPGNVRIRPGYVSSPYQTVPRTDGTPRLSLTRAARRPNIWWGLALKDRRYGFRATRRSLNILQLVFASFPLSPSRRPWRDRFARYSLGDCLVGRAVRVLDHQIILDSLDHGAMQDC